MLKKYFFIFHFLKKILTEEEGPTLFLRVLVQGNKVFFGCGFVRCYVGG